MNMSRGKFGRMVAGAAAALMLASAMPASAQQYSDGYKFLKAVKDRDTAEVNKMLQEPGSTVINARDLATGESALHVAVKARDLSWIRFLTSKGANPNIADKKGVTPLILACRMGLIDGVQALVDAGARVDEPNNAGETPLISAVHARDTGLMRVLLKAGADPDRADNSGRTARDYARLDGASSQTLAEIERNAEERAADRKAEGEVYGPSF
ncbi:ankyrin repeat protein [Altererythrobacter atlanticus]|nr:ankyrin repeat domain-containing protein [Croceibacterium atlanticum]MBB5732278.1 ankyrin repeat protein [Croceibacterium atlanticum]